MRAFTLGADPELFVGVNGEARSIIGKVGGTKERPRPLLELGDGYGVQEDNVAMEFNVPPAATKEAFVSSIYNTVMFLGELVRDMYGYSVLPQSAIVFPEQELNTPQALTFGCDPDYNAWTMKRNPRPKAANKALRSCGGHIHIGIDATKEEKAQLVKFMDLCVGVPSVLLDDGIVRKELYGAAGACRLKSYGVEYRTPSNFWVFDQTLIGWVYDATTRAVEMLDSGLPIDEEQDVIVNCINKNNKQVAEELILKYSLPIV